MLATSFWLISLVSNKPNHESVDKLAADEKVSEGTQAGHHSDQISSVEFNQEFKLDKNKVKSIVSDKYLEKYQELQEIFGILPKDVHILVLDNFESYVDEVQSDLPDEDIPNGATYLIDENANAGAVKDADVVRNADAEIDAETDTDSSVQVKVVIYTAKLDNLPAVYSHVSNIIDHELVHAFQMNYLKGNLYSKPLWLIEAQAQYYENPLKYGNYSKSNFSSLSDIDFGLVSQDASLRTESYAIAKDFYEYLLTLENEDVVINYLEELPSDIDQRFQTFLEG